MVISRTLVLALSLKSLSSLPYDVVCRHSPSVAVAKACFRSGEKKIPKRVGTSTRTQPCFTLLLMLKGQACCLHIALAFVLWWKDLIMLCSFGGHPIFTSILKSPSRSFPADQVERFREVNEGDVHRLSFCCSLHLNRPIRLTQCCTQFKSLGVKILCVLNLHDNEAFTFK